MIASFFFGSQRRKDGRPLGEPAGPGPTHPSFFIQPPRKRKMDGPSASQPRLDRAIILFSGPRRERLMTVWSLEQGLGQAATAKIVDWPRPAAKNQLWLRASQPRPRRKGWTAHGAAGPAKRKDGRARPSSCRERKKMDGPSASQLDLARAIHLLYSTKEE